MTKPLNQNDQRQAFDALRMLVSRMGGADIAQFKARMYEGEMVDLLAAFALDPFLKVEFRRQCAIDVLLRARGQPVQPVKVEHTALPDPTSADDPLIADMRLAEDQAREMAELQRWLRIPRSQWPAEVVARFEQTAAVLAAPVPER